MKPAAALAALIVSFAPCLASGQTPPPPPPREAATAEMVSVVGIGKSTLAPDRMSFTVGVQTEAATVASALQENNAKVTRLIAALKAQGATEKEIRTSQVSISPQMDYQQGRPPRILGYQVQNSVTVTRDNPADVGKFLQAAVDAGANQVSGVSFTVADETRGRDRGLEAAFADARQKAEVLARAAGRTLGRAVAITEGAAAHPPVPLMMKGRAMEMQAASDMAVPIEQGTEELRFTVSVVFELR